VTVINGLPAHVLFVHFLVVLAPMTALLEIACALWPAARRGQLVWLTLILAIVTTVLTPITTNAGEWLYDLRRNPDPMLREHAERGDTMIYFSVALLVVAIALMALHFVERRADKRRLLTNTIVAVVALAVGVPSMIQIYRIGDAGAQSVWGDEITHLKKANGMGLSVGPVSSGPAGLVGR
jgi:uncharacterized membrane protein